MKEVNNEKVLSILDNEYQEWIKDLKTRYKQSQIKAAIKVNSELVQFYWSLGRDIVKMKSEAKWGSKFYDSLSKDLREMLPDSKGFSKRNLRYARQFYELFPEDEIGQQLVAQLFMVPWGHIVFLLQYVGNDRTKVMFYIQKTIENNWSRSMLLNYLDSDLYERSGKAINNFKMTLPNADSDLSNDILKNPYNFTFLTLEEKYTEKEMKKALVANIQNFLLELGTGFAYMGNEYRLDVGGSDQYIDMLFYNAKVHAYVVIEIKTTAFKPEYVGQLGTYVVAVDHMLRTEKDEKTIGILVCKYKNDVLAGYALESSSQPIGVSSYELSKLIPEEFKSSFPTVEEIENELSKKEKKQ